MKTIDKSHKAPVVEFSDMSLSSNSYVDTEGNMWSVPTLIQYCKDKNYPIFKMPLACVDISYLPWNIKNTDDFIWHMKRVNKVDTEYPIIITNLGIIADGYHRICKAMLDGKSEINAIRMVDMPAPTGHKE